MMIFLNNATGAVLISIVNVVDNDDDNEFVNVAFFLQIILVAKLFAVVRGPWSPSRRSSVINGSPLSVTLHLCKESAEASK
jgi:hypothetical protein